MPECAQGPIDNLGRSWKQILTERAVFDQCCWLGAEKLYTSLGGIYKVVAIRLRFCTFLSHFCNGLSEIEYSTLFSFSLQNIRWWFTVPDKSEISLSSKRKIATCVSVLLFHPGRQYYLDIVPLPPFDNRQQRQWTDVNGQHKCLLFPPARMRYNTLHNDLTPRLPISYAHGWITPPLSGTGLSGFHIA